MVRRLSCDPDQLRAELVAMVYSAEPYPTWYDLPVHTQETDAAWSECRAMHELWLEYGD